MNRVKYFFTTALILVNLLTSNAQNQKDMELMNLSEEQQAVLNAIEKMNKAFHEKDIKGVMNSYEANAVVVFEPEKPVSDPAILKEMFLATFNINPKFVFSGHEVFINGNIATHFAPWLMTGEGPDGTKIQQSGLSVAVLRKQADGNWLMIFDNPHGQFLMNK